MDAKDSWRARRDLSAAIGLAVKRLRDSELSEGCNQCEGLDAEAIERIASDLEHALRALPVQRGEEK
jgi:hypothetical protein